MKRTLACLSLAMVLGVSAFAQASSLANSPCSKDSCKYKCAQTCCEGDCTEHCCKGK